MRAERATLRAGISISSPDRTQSIRSATELHNTVAKRAEQLRASGDATWLHASAPSTWVRRWTDDAGAEHRAHVTASQVQIKLSNLDLVAALNEELSETGTTVHITWTITDVTRKAVTAKVRALAVHDAQAKATDFAAALGREVVATVELREESDGGPVLMRSAAGAASHESAAVSVPEITVSVAVSADFLTS